MDIFANIENSIVLVLLTIIGGLITNSVVGFIRNRGESQTARLTAEEETKRHDRRIEADLNEHLLSALQQATSERDKAQRALEPILIRCRTLAAHLQRVLTSSTEHDRKQAEEDAAAYLAHIDGEDTLLTP